MFLYTPLRHVLPMLNLKYVSYVHRCFAKKTKIVGPLFVLKAYL